MNTNIRYILLMLMSCLLWSCETEDFTGMFISKYKVNTPASAAIGGAMGDETTIQITADCEWSIENLPNWLTAEPKSGNGDATVTLKATQSNPDPSGTRYQNITVSADKGKIKQTITVTQERGPENIGFVDRIEFTCVEQTKTYPLSIQGSWKIQASDWLTISPVSGTGDAVISITVAENRGGEKDGVLTIKAEATSATKEVTVIQKAYELFLTVTSDAFTSDEGKNKTMEFGKSGGTKNILIESSDAWVVETMPEWITMGRQNSEKGGVFDVAITAAANAGAPREGRILIKNTADETYYVIVNFKQEGADQYLELLSDPDIAFEAAGGTNTVLVQSSADLTIAGTGEGSWITVDSKNEANHIYTVVLRAAANEGASRNATIVITNGTDLEKITLHATQQGSALPTFPEFQVYETWSSGIMVGGIFKSPTPVTEYGLCVSTTSQFPTKSDAMDIRPGEQQTEAEFRLEAFDLQPSTTYYVRAFADNEEGTGYSKTITVKTSDPDAPYIIYFDVENVDSTLIIVRGAFESEVKVTECGLLLSERNEAPTMDDVVQRQSFDDQYGEFLFEQTGLKPNTRYYLRAYATSAGGTTLSQPISVTTTGNIPNENDNRPPSTN